MADYINSVMEDFRENNLKNAYKILEAESFKRRIFSYNLEDNLEYFERKHNDYFYSVALVFYLFFSLLNCIGFNKNFSWSYSFSLYIFLNLVLLWGIIYIFFRQKDYIYKIGKVFLGNVLLLILIFLYFPFFDDVVLDQGRYFNVILTDNKMKFILLIFAFCIYYYSVVKIYNKFSFVGIISNDLNRKKQEKYNLYKQQNEFYRNQNKFENPWIVIDCTTKEKNLDYPIKSLPNFATRMGYRPNKIKPIPAIEQYENKYASLEKDIKQEQDIINTSTVNSNDNNKVDCIANNEEKAIPVCEQDENKYANLKKNITQEQDIINISTIDNNNNNKINCIENNVEKTIDTQSEKQKNSDKKCTSKKGMQFVFYKLFSSIVSVEEAKDLPFKDFYKLFCDTYNGQTITIENISFIFEKNKFYKHNPNKKKKITYYKKKTLKTRYSLFCNNKLI